MVVCLTIYTAIVTILLLLYAFFDVNYFLRVAFIIGRGRLFESKKRVDERIEIYGLCTTQDIDIVFKHMNNARYVRELDFARFHFYDRTGLYKELMKANGNILQTASNIRYRRTIPLLSAYKIITKLIFWDKTNLFMEQQFVTLSDNFVRAIILSKQSTIGINLPELMARLTGRDVAYRPTLLPELEDWLKSIEKSSARLKKSD